MSDTTGASSSIALTAGGGGTNLFTALTGFVAVRTASAGTAAKENWQFASLTGKIYMAQAGQYFTCLNESTFAVESVTNQPWTSSPNVVIAADGRLWAADDAAGSNSYTVVVVEPAGREGLDRRRRGHLDVRNVWPNGQDTIVALAFMSGRLVILGRRSILLYTLPPTHDPASMDLTGVISNIGSRARDSVVIANTSVQKNETCWHL